MIDLEKQMKKYGPGFELRNAGHDVWLWFNRDERVWVLHSVACNFHHEWPEEAFGGALKKFMEYVQW